MGGEERRVGEGWRVGGRRTRGRDERVMSRPRREVGWEVRGPPVLRLGEGMRRRKEARREGRRRVEGERERGGRGLR